ncbi:Bacterial regulatory protein, arsR family [uncultured archaeon]|nr:Bacterial regulatory protein, arsR family [uncultured archaeon]
MKNNSSYYVFFSHLSNPLKMRLILELQKSPKNVNQLTSSLRVEQSKISHALSSLKQCNIVSVKPEGKQRIYSLNSRMILPMLKLIDTHANKYCNCETCGEIQCSAKN